jgi:hypothetical protein
MTERRGGHAHKLQTCGSGVVVGDGGCGLQVANLWEQVGSMPTSCKLAGAGECGGIIPTSSKLAGAEVFPD